MTLSPTGTKMQLVHKPTMYNYRNIYISLFFFFFYLHSDIRFCFTFYNDAETTERGIYPVSYQCGETLDKVSSFIEGFVAES